MFLVFTNEADSLTAVTYLSTNEPSSYFTSRKKELVSEWFVQHPVDENLLSGW